MLQRWSNRVKGDRNARAEIGRKGRRNELPGCHCHLEAGNKIRKR